MDVNQLVDAHVARFNEAVAASDFTPFVDSFSDGARLAFIGRNVGPFNGRAAIDLAYRLSPPDDAIDLVAVKTTGPASAIAQYYWRSDVLKRTGEMRMSWDADGLLDDLEVDLP
jgi:hypothetical protein